VCSRTKRQLQAKNLTILFLRSRLSIENKNDTNVRTATVPPGTMFHPVVPPTPCYITPMDNVESPINRHDDAYRRNHTATDKKNSPDKSSLIHVLKECLSLQKKLRSGTVGGLAQRYDHPSPFSYSMMDDIEEEETPLNDKNKSDNEMKILNILRDCVDSTTQLCHQLESERDKNSTDKVNAKMLKEQLKLTKVQNKTWNEKCVLAENELQTTEDRLISATKTIDKLQVGIADVCHQLESERDKKSSDKVNAKMLKELKLTKVQNKTWNEKYVLAENELQTTEDRLISATQTIDELQVGIADACHQLESERDKNSTDKVNAEMLKEQLKLTQVQIKTWNENYVMAENELQTTEDRLLNATKTVGELQVGIADACHQLQNERAKKSFDKVNAKKLKEQLKLTKSYNKTWNQKYVLAKNELQATKDELLSATTTIGELQEGISDAKACSYDTDGDYDVDNEYYSECQGGSLTQLVSKIDNNVEHGRKKDPDVIHVERLVVGARTSMESKVNGYLAENQTSSMYQRNNNRTSNSLFNNINTLARMSALFPPSLITAMHGLRLIGNDCAHDKNTRSRAQLTAIIKEFEEELASFEKKKKKKVWIPP